MSTGESSDDVPMIEDAYKEVLDATKHQDDKIGRLLAGVAFLTAAALALGGIGGGKYLGQTFVLGDHRWHLVAVGLLGFLVSVSLAVVLLVGSLSTPLKLPGRRGSRDDLSSPIYFYAIAGRSLDQWQAEWDAKTPEQLARWKREALLRETHNLAIRCAYKFDRLTEAAGMLAIALTSFSFTIVAIFVAATAAPGAAPAAATTSGAAGAGITAATATAGIPPDGGGTAISLTHVDRWLLGAVLSSFCLTQLVVRLRAQQLKVELMAPPWKSGAWLERAMTLLLPLSILLGAGWDSDGGWEAWCKSLVIGGLGVGFAEVFRRSYRAPFSEPQDASASRRPSVLEVIIRRGIHALGVSVYLLVTGTAVYGAARSDYAISFAAALLTVTLLPLPTLIEPTLSMWRRIDRYEGRLT